jgi:hypothetical protein
MAQQDSHTLKSVNQRPNFSGIEDKLHMLTQSISEVYKYELLTTNQYLKQMKLILDIFHEITDQIDPY